jgi:DNA polymerase III delta prime subunit
MNNKIPWMEKYRPTDINNIIMDRNNSSFFKNMIQKNIFPNLLFHGPPGTGKTTTIINLVKLYQNNNNQNNNELMIHLNASDDRGIYTIRNQIYQFVNSNTFFNNGLKFIILDEVDYMTKSAQQALKYLLNDIKSNVCICLICNYITKIDKSLQNEYIHIRFDNLPVHNILNLLNNINIQENINYNQEQLSSIQKIYKSDIRSMINYMQLNTNISSLNKIITNKLWVSLTEKIKIKDYSYLDIITIEYNIQLKNLIIDYINYLINNNTNFINSDFLNISEFIIHLEDVNDAYLKELFIDIMNDYFSKNII